MTKALRKTCRAYNFLLIVDLYMDCMPTADINECDLNIDDCDQLCVNDLESYYCECYTGYLRDNYSSSCLG